MHIEIIVKKKQLAGEKERKRKTAQIGTNVRACIFNARLLARSQFTSRRSCDQPTLSRFSMVFLGLGANTELVPKFHNALHASHAALSMVILQISSYINVTLGWITLFMEDMGEGALHREERK
jgi:hypothetical protein